MLLAGCASYSGRGLTPGRSSAEDVAALMGPAAERRAGAAGETVLYYSRLPEGGQTYAARIGPDGKLVALEQRLAPEYRLTVPASAGVVGTRYSVARPLSAWSRSKSALPFERCCATCARASLDAPPAPPLDEFAAGKRSGCP